MKGHGKGRLRVIDEANAFYFFHFLRRPGLVWSGPVGCLKKRWVFMIKKRIMGIIG